MTNRMLTTLALSATLAAASVAPALADGAASTRNILIGAGVGTLLIINHNKKVHERYAEDARRQASTQAAADNAQAAYASERTAYQHEATLVAEYKHEVAVQHQQVLALRHQVAVERSRSNRSVAAAPGLSKQGEVRVASNSTGWGQF